MQPLLLGGVCFITGAHPSLDIPEQVEIVLRAGIRCVQLREKNSSRREIYNLAKILRELTARCCAALIINDYPDIALSAGADGVHLGQEDLPLNEARKLMGSRIIGISTHSLEEALSAQAGGADYIGFGPIFQTKTKKTGVPPRGPEMLSLVRQKIRIPIMAIGGITAGSLMDVMAAGANAVAASGAVLEGDAFANAVRFAEFFRNPETAGSGVKAI